MGILPDAHRLYSDYIAYRLQTEAFFRGDLSLSSSLGSLRHDFAWANGVQQVWGLGVPLLRLPFEMWAKLFGFSSFPDRLVFVFYFGITIFLVFWGIRKVESDEFSAHKKVGSYGFFRWGLAGFTLIAFPPFIHMLRARFWVYEEAVAFAYCSVVVSVVLWMLYRVRRDVRVWYWICFLSGFVILIRPPFFSYGLLIFASSFLLSMGRISKSHLVGGLLLFVFFPTCTLLTNTLRFGEFWEYGHRLNHTILPPKLMDWKFGYPFAHESLISAARELFAALFLSPAMNPTDFYKSDIHSWFSSTIRSRQFYFPTFSLIHALVLGGGLVTFCACLRDILKRLRSRASLKTEDALLSLGLLSFGMLFVFYLRKPSINSRYFIDLAPAVSFVMLALFLKVFHFLQNDRDYRGSTWGFRRFLDWIGWAVVTVILLSPHLTHVHRSKPRSSTARELPVLLRSVDIPNDRIPTSYACQRPPANLPIFGNLAGWNIDKDCRVDVLSMLFLRDFSCVRLKVEGGRRDLPLDSIEVKVQLETLERYSIAHEGMMSDLIFCPHNKDRVFNGPQTVFIAWTNPDARKVPEDLRLLLIEGSVGL